MGLLVLFEQEFAVVHDAYNRRFSGRRHLDEIKLSLAGHLERVVPGHDSGLRSVCCDHAQLRCGDLLIAPDALRCDGDALILPRSAPAAFELDAKPFQERLRRHRAQVLAASSAHR